MDEIRINNLEVFANHGVFPEENQLGQKFVVSAILYTDIREAGMTDQLEKSIHYGMVSQDICRILQEHTYMLLERVAEVVCEELLLQYARLQAITLEIKKPWAPVHLHVDTISVKIHRGWHTAYLALGSNLGDRKGYLDFAVEEFKKQRGIQIKKIASYLETEPYGENAKYMFLNSCMEIRTLFPPQELLLFSQKVERDGARTREVHWGPRTLDVDLLFYDQEIISEENLLIPHPEIEKRTFVLEPMCEIAPYLRHPISKKTMKQLLSDVKYR